MQFSQKLTQAVDGRPRVMREGPKLLVKLMKSLPGAWSSLGQLPVELWVSAPLEEEAQSALFVSCVLVAREKDTHDTDIFRFAVPQSSPADQWVVRYPASVV